MSSITLNDLKLGEIGIIISNDIRKDNGQNISNLGVSKGSTIKSLFKSPLGDPTAYLIKNVIIAIREEDAKHIKIVRKENGTY